jgi:hypothetical protein
MVLPAVTGPPSQPPMASQPAHGVLQHHPAGRPSTDQADQVVLVVEPGDSVADLADGVHNRVVHSLEETGAMVPSNSPVPGQAVHGQSGGTETSAQLLTGLAGPLAPGLQVRHGPPGLLVLLQSLLLPSTQLHHSAALLHTPPQALVIRLLRLRLQALPLHKPLALVVLPPSPLQVALQLRPSWASSLCYRSIDPICSDNKKNVLIDWHFLGFVHSLRREVSWLEALGMERMVWF